MPELVIYWFNSNRKPLAKIPLPLQTTHPPPPQKKKILATGLYYDEMIICEIQVGKSVHQAEKINRNDVDRPNGILGWFLNIFSCRQPMQGYFYQGGQGGIAPLEFWQPKKVQNFVCQVRYDYPPRSGGG